MGKALSRRLAEHPVIWAVLSGALLTAVVTVSLLLSGVGAPYTPQANVHLDPSSGQVAP